MVMTAPVSFAFPETVGYSARLKVHEYHPECMGEGSAVPVLIGHYFQYSSKYVAPGSTLMLMVTAQRLYAY